MSPTPQSPERSGIKMAFERSQVLFVSLKCSWALAGFVSELLTLGLVVFFLFGIREDEEMRRAGWKCKSKLFSFFHHGLIYATTCLEIAMAADRSSTKSIDLSLIMSQTSRFQTSRVVLHMTDKYPCMFVWRTILCGWEGKLKSMNLIPSANQVSYSLHACRWAWFYRCKSLSSPLPLHPSRFPSPCCKGSYMVKTLFLMTKTCVGCLQLWEYPTSMALLPLHPRTHPRSQMWSRYCSEGRQHSRQVTLAPLLYLSHY